MAGIAAAAMAAAAGPTWASAATVSAPAKARYVVIARTAGDMSALKAEASRHGAVVHDLGGTRTMAVDATPSEVSALRSSGLASTVAKDRVNRLIDPESPAITSAPKKQSRHVIGGGNGGKADLDPAFGLKGLMWNLDRIRSPQANRITEGSHAVTVAVADTGLDYTHSELAKQVTKVVDFTQTEDPPICATAFPDIGGDADLAATYGGPENTDWNGHGSWIGGNIAAALDGVGINGIAPKVNLVALKISQWCGSAYDSELLAAFEYAGAHHIDVVSISFGGYSDRSDPEQEAIYQAYVDTVATAREQGTLIVASAGNEHVRVGAGGKVLSHGQLSTPGDTAEDWPDLFGMYETPGGIPGVIDVSSSGNVVAAPTADCDVTENLDLLGNPTCKPDTDAHQPFGVGRQDQLAYYSNYGPRIDIAAPGGARKFALPVWDGGATPGFPYTEADGFTAFQDFSITSNWAVEIPCVTFSAPTIFYPGECYSTIQGTSMATPHVSAVAALIASANKGVRHEPDAIQRILLNSARGGVRNLTPPLSATDTSPGDLSGLPCTIGYCHLGGRPIRSGEAYGAGIVDALAAVRRAS
jgi:subtilisin family serine protease